MAKMTYLNKNIIIKIEKGVKQGGTILPKLFTFMLQ